MKAWKNAAAASMLALLAAVCTTPAGPEHPDDPLAPIAVPKIWDDAELATWAVPLAGLGVAPAFFSEGEYYAAPIDNLRTYPVYHPDREPPGYRDRLRALGPQPLIEPEKLHTRAEWIEAGRRVFEELDTPACRTSDPAVLAHFDDPKAVDRYRDESHDVLLADGVLLDYRWVVDRDGTLKMSVSNCQGCHTRLMPDGSLLPGAPSNYDLGDSPAAAAMLEKLDLSPKLGKGPEAYAAFGVPWVEGDVHARFQSMSDEEFDRFSAQDSGEPPGTMFARFNGSPFHETRMADLRGIRHRKYLDATGTHLHRGPADLARYCILVEFADCATFGEHRMLPPEAMHIARRPPDEAVFAMALYLESLETPPSPHPFDDLARKGEKVFEAEGCEECHTPPWFTNNKLIPVPGFKPPKGDPATKRLDISKRRVDTDPGLALKTRKGTGYYRVPSLRGLWYRGLFEHDGSVASLDDWFDEDRLEDDYVPTGWRGPGVRTRAVPGHEFGLDRSPDKKRALIAYLKTL